MKKVLKKIVLIIGILCVIGLIVLARIFIFLPPQESPSGILLSFDDYYPDNWEAHFDLLEKYDADVTFFINSLVPTEFCYKAVAEGHEIGFHTRNHVDLVDATEEELFEEVIEPLEHFRNAGFPLTTFAYPYGNYTDSLNEELLQYFKVLRGGWHYQLNSKENLKSGLVEARCIDNVNFASELRYKLIINKMLYEARWQEGTVVALYSHGIEHGDWCISPERLEYLLKRAKQLDMEIYTFSDLQ